VRKYRAVALIYPKLFQASVNNKVGPTNRKYHNMSLRVFYRFGKTFAPGGGIHRLGMRQFSSLISSEEMIASINSKISELEIQQTRQAAESAIPLIERLPHAVRTFMTTWLDPW